MTIIWCAVPEIWSITDRIFYYFRPIFALLLPYGPRKSKSWRHENNTWRYYHFTRVYHKWQSYDVWFLRYKAWRTEFFIILDQFLPFYSPMDPENQNFENMRIMPGDIVILHMFTKNHDHMLHCSLDTIREGCNFYFSFWAMFSPFTLLTTQKIKI